MSDYPKRIDDGATRPCRETVAAHSSPPGQQPAIIRMTSTQVRWDATVFFQATSHNSIIRMIVLKAGDRAPLFSVIDDAERTVSLADFTGHIVVLFFYPKDDTSG